MVALMRMVFVDVPVTLEAGRFYRAVFEDRPGLDDFDVRETTEENARQFAVLGQQPPCNLDTPDVIEPAEALPAVLRDRRDPWGNDRE